MHRTSLLINKGLIRGGEQWRDIKDSASPNQKTYIIQDDEKSSDESAMNFIVTNHSYSFRSAAPKSCE